MKIFALHAELASANALKRPSLKALLIPSTLISASNAELALTFVRARLFPGLFSFRVKGQLQQELRCHKDNRP